MKDAQHEHQVSRLHAVSLDQELVRALNTLVQEQNKRAEAEKKAAKLEKKLEVEHKARAEIQAAMDQQVQAREVQAVRRGRTTNDDDLLMKQALSKRLSDEVQYWRNFALSFDAPEFRRHMASGAPASSPIHPSETPARRGQAVDDASPQIDELQTPATALRGLHTIKGAQNTPSKLKAETNKQLGKVEEDVVGPLGNDPLEEAD
jgi:hypothetical protein